MILYHFSTSPFSRRVRLALAHKGLTVELKDARSVPAEREAVNRLNPMHTVPVLVDGDRVVCHTSAILQHLEDLTPTPSMFPSGYDRVRSQEWIAHTDSIITIVIDLGLRLAPVHGAQGYADVRRELGGRAQRALHLLARELPHSPSWLVGEWAVHTMVSWLEGLPARVATFAPAQAMVDIGLQVPEPLAAWSRAQAARDDVRAL